MLDGVQPAPDRVTAPPRTAVIGTVLFVLLVPGSVVVLVPYLISGWTLAPPLLGTALTRALGALLIVAAAPLFVSFVRRFVSEGHGTPAPIAPTRHLVVGGPFQVVRNPGYVAVIALVVGQGLLLASVGVLLYAAFLMFAFHGFVVRYEEPTLERTFGEQYVEYCRRVPRWLPRLRRGRA